MGHLMFLGIRFGSVLIAAAIAYFVYQDAEKRSMPNSIVWAIGTFFCCPIVPIIYLIVRK